MGILDGARKGRLHSHVPFIGCKTLTVRQKTYDDIMGYYRARVEHLFARQSILGRSRESWSTIYRCAHVVQKYPLTMPYFGQTPFHHRY